MYIFYKITVTTQDIARLLSAFLLIFLGSVFAESAEETDPKYVSLNEAHDGRLAIDIKILNQFEDQPAETVAFYTEARDAILGGETHQHLVDVCKKFGVKTIGKAMLGRLTSESVTVRVQTPEKVELSVIVKSEKKEKTFVSSRANTISFITCDKLTPNTDYTYSVISSKEEILAEGSFTTPPAAGAGISYKIAVGADFHKIGLHRPELLELVEKRDNLAMMLLGDLSVDGRRTVPLRNIDNLLRDVSPVWQKFSVNVPSYTSWDDHDFYGNDTGGLYYKKPENVIPVLQMRANWKEMWNNPESDISRKGIYFQTVIGDTHIIMLDTRSCRVNENRGKLHSFLGKEQTEWLRKTLNKSKSPFILLSGGTMWTDYISNGKDSWGTWDKKGREELYEVLDELKNKKILLFSGDRHGAHAFKIKRPNGKEYIEFGVGTLGGVPGGGKASDTSNQLFAYPGRGTWAFGELEFSFTENSPHVTFKLINTQETILEEIKI